ncbi:bacterial regulatory helix-turn-helix, lysR family protein [Collimonas arenae]|uniref:Bacterial regulatory helix-turn-helix, lysR family protein n=1 Tax=Collimonas arenae TaxID=279058 RepID=A0A127QLF9_9BURK|nr:LysR family transcriptional regulator [Collimonas arenae]AMP00978.1 bacterial regulatory helix-turn-helix, lysR family protein [Collimonas arenae]AMP10871.1 bacterial regulatory helix-turn-helix, lysR family protein [Collimonas arenae]
MRLTIRQLQIFLAVAQSGSTTAASEQLALSQSATSAALNELENLLDCRLFDRVGKRLVLNDNGRVLLPQAGQVVDAAKTIEQQFLMPDMAQGGGLQIGSSTTIGSYLLPSLIASYRQQHSELQVRVTIANTADIVAAVVNFEVDVGLIEGPCHASDLQVEPWMVDELLIVSSPQHPIAAGDKKVSVAQLRAAEWLLREPGSGTREAVEQALLPHLHHLQQSCEFGNSEAIKHAAAAGLGISCLSHAVVEDFLQSGRLVVLNTTLPRLHRHFYLIHSKHKILSLRLMQFLAFCRSWS